MAASTPMQEIKVSLEEYDPDVLIQTWTMIFMLFFWQKLEHLSSRMKTASAPDPTCPDLQLRYGPRCQSQLNLSTSDDSHPTWWRGI